LALPAGTRIGVYDITAPIGEGGMDLSFHLCNLNGDALTIA
jgi:hypothetical protein